MNTSPQVQESSQTPNSRPAMTALTVLLAMVMLAVSLIGTGAADADVDASHDTLISEYASFLTPGVVDGRVEAITVANDIVFVGGTFTQVQEAGGGDVIDQPHLFAFRKSTGAILQDFRPDLNDEVWALETTASGDAVFVGGAFTTVNGATNKKGLTKLNLEGERVYGFAGRTDARVKTLVRSGTTLYVGGTFTKIGSTPVENLAAIDTTTGLVLPTINLDFAGPFSTFRNVGVQSVDEIDITSDGRLLVVVGNFSSINGIPRSRIAVLNLRSRMARVSTWNTNVFDTQCPSQIFPQYILGLDIAPDDSYFVTGTSGYKIVDNPACDTTLRFDFGDLRDSDVMPTWSNYTGGDSVYEVAVSGEAVYIGGHFRTLNNPYSPNGGRTGPGAIPRLGMAALDPLNGLPILDWRADRNPRGRGTFALLVEDDGLWIGDDTDFINNSKHPKLKFLPTTSSTAIARPQQATLPTTIFTSNGSGLDGVSFDGFEFGGPVELLDSGWGFDVSRGAMFLGGQLFSAQTDGTMWMRSFDGTDFGPRQKVNMYGLSNSDWDLSQVTGMYFDHETGRVYYNQLDDNRLFYRYFSPAGPVFGTQEFVGAEFGGIDWSQVRGMDVIDGDLYFGHSNGNLYRAAMNGSVPTASTTVLVSGPGIDGRDWSDPALAFFSGGELFPSSNIAEFALESAGSSTTKSFQTFDIPVAPDAPVTVKLEWDDPTADLRVFLRNEAGVTVDSDTSTGNSPKWVMAQSSIGGTWSVAVKVKSGSTPYRVLVNPTEQPPAPAAEFEFEAAGSADSGSFKTFKVPVVAGEQVNVQVAWADAGAVLNVFLRDETGTKIESDTTGAGSPLNLSTIADSTGNWSVAVKIKNGATAYDVLVDTIG